MKSLLVIAILSLISVKQSSAETTNSCNSQWRKVLKKKSASIWARCWENDTKTLARSLFREFQTVSKNPLFKEKLPKTVGILIDGSWSKTSGYWAENLKTPDNQPAILVAPEAVLEAIPAQKILAHELIHLIHHVARPHEEAWVREGVALLSEYVITSFHNPAILEGFANPETSLRATRDPGATDYEGIEAQLAQYGHVAQYFYYLHRLCGGDDFLKKVIESTSELAGIEFLDEVLNDTKIELKACASFKESFTSFQTARFLNNTLKPENFVYPNRRTTTTRDDPDYPLPAYSASAYTRPDKQKTCRKGEIDLEPRRCLRIRFE